MFKIILTIGTIQALAVFLQFIKSKIVAVYLGPAGVGVVGTIDQFVQLAAYLCCLSLPAASLKFLSKSHSEGHEEFKRSYAGFFKLLLLLSLAGTVLSVSAVLFKPDILGAEFEKYNSFLILGLLTIPAFTLTTLFVNVFASTQKFKASSLLVVATNAAMLIASVTGVVAAGIFGFYAGNIAAGIALTVGVMFYFQRRLELPLYNRRTKILDELKRNPDISILALMLYGGAIAASLAFLVARYSTLKNFGEVEAGFLHGLIALSLALGMALNPAINLYLTPNINRNIDKQEKIRRAVQFQKKMAFVLSLGALLIILFPQTMLTLMFSEKFAAVGHLVYLFVVSQFILQLAGVQQALLISLDDIKTYTVVTTAGQLIFAALCLLLIPRFGIKGAAFGQIAGNAFIFGLTLIRLKLKHSFIVPHNVNLLLAYTFGVLILAGLFGNQSAELDITNVLLKIGFMFLFGASYFLFLSREEKEFIGSLRGRFSAAK